MISLQSVQCASNAISSLLFLPYTRAYIRAYISATWLEIPLNPVLYRELEFLWTFFRFKRVLMANFLISSTINTDEATDINNKMSVQYRASVWKTAWSGGKWITSICPMVEPPTAYRNMRFVKKPTWKVDLTWKTRNSQGYDNCGYSRLWINNTHQELVPAFHYSLYLTLYKLDISKRRTLN